MTTIFKEPWKAYKTSLNEVMPMLGKIRWSFVLCFCQSAFAMLLIAWAGRQFRDFAPLGVAWDYVPPALKAADMLNFPVLPIVYFAGHRPEALFALPDSYIRLVTYLVCSGILWFWIGRIMERPRNERLPSRGPVRISLMCLAVLYGLLLVALSSFIAVSGPYAIYLPGAGVLWGLFFLTYFSRRLYRASGHVAQPSGEALEQ